jgi:hypothetical protein
MFFWYRYVALKILNIICCEDSFSGTHSSHESIVRDVDFTVICIKHAQTYNIDYSNAIFAH